MTLTARGIPGVGWEDPSRRRTGFVWLAACRTYGNLGCGRVKVDCWRVFREVESTGARFYDGSVVLVVARALGLERRGDMANIRRSLI